MTAYLLDTDTASRLIRLDRRTVAALRRSSASDVGISVVTKSELLYGAHLRPQNTEIMSAIRSFLDRVTVHVWDDEAAEYHARIRAAARAAGRSAGIIDLMIAAHAAALGAILVSSDAAIANLRIERLTVIDWH
jgi:tRNA(fMet)-specific endonuclease VapC